MARPAQTIRSAAQAVWPGASVFARGRNHIVHAHPSEPGRFMVDTGIGPLHIAGTETEIDTAFVATTGAWQYQMVTADFHVFSRNQLGVGTMYRYQDPTSGEFVEFQPLALNWVNDSDSRQQITQPQSVVAQVVDGDTLYFPNGYGTGRHFQYSAQPARFVKLLTIDALANLPTPTVTGAPHLEIEFVITKSAGVSEWIDGAQWDRSTRVQTAGRIEYRNSGGTVLWALDYPRAWDSAGNETIGQMTLRRQGANRLVTVRIPKAWLDTATFPIFLDPTIDAQVGASENDASQNQGGGSMSITGVGVAMSSNATAGSRFIGGARFTNVTIPAGATIDVAYITVVARATTHDSPNTDLYCEDEDNPGDFNGTILRDRVRTTASAGWVATDIGTGSVNSPSIVSPVQEVVDRAGWASGNALVVIGVGRSDFTSPFEPRSYDSSTTDAIKLHVEYTAGGGGDLSANKSESITVAESVAVRLESHINKSEAVSAAEAVNLTLVHQVAVSDSVAVAESVSVRLELHVNVSESVSVAEAVTLLPESYIGVSESVTVADAVALLLESYINVSDSVAVAEAINVALAHQVSVSNAVSVAESVNLLLESYINVNEAIAVAESVAVSIVEAGALTISVSESITVAESVALLVESYVSVSESVGVSESLNIALVHQISVSDAVSVAEAVAALLESHIDKSEAITVAEAVTMEMVSFINISESITVDESVNVSIVVAGGMDISVSDSVTVSESIKLELVSFISVSDSVAVVEAVALEVVSFINVNDAVAVAELVNVSLAHQIAVIDAVAVTESINAILESFINVSEAITVNESVTMGGIEYFINVSDSISVAELVTVLIVTVGQMRDAKFKGMYRGMFRRMR